MTTRRDLALGYELPNDLEPHPLAEKFRPFTDQEFDDLVGDIRANGQQHTIVLYEDRILDGVHRYKACLKAGIKPRGKPYAGINPVAYVGSANLHRRHLSVEQRRELAATLIKAAPEKSNRQIADEVKISHPTVAKVREELEHAGDVEAVSTSIDTKGRRQPRSKPAPGARRGAVRPSPRPARQPAAVPPLDSRSWSETAEKDKKQPVGSPSARERFLSAIGYDDWWHCAPEAFRERARRELLATPSVPAGEMTNDLIGAAKDDPMAIPAALKRTAPTDRFGRPRPTPGSLLKGSKK